VGPLEAADIDDIKENCYSTMGVLKNSKGNSALLHNGVLKL
jgi:hypothetical protein